MSSGNYTARLLPGGAVEISAGDDLYRVSSLFSEPGSSIRWLSLGEDKPEEGNVFIARSTEGFSVRLDGANYRIERMIRLEPGRLRIKDRFANPGSEDIGILMEHRLWAPSRGFVTIGGVRVGGFWKEWVKDILREHGRLGVRPPSPENPTLHLELPSSSLGFVAEDSVFRLQFEPAMRLGGVAARARHFAVRARDSAEVEWSLYPSAQPDGYFGFINKVRSDWNVNFTVTGPWDFFDLIKNEALLSDPAALRMHLRKKRLKVVTFWPWLDYDNWDPRAGARIDRKRYRMLAKRAAAAFRRADPAIKCLGAIQSNLILLPEALSRRLTEALEPHERVAGIRALTDRQMAALQGQVLPYEGSWVRTSDGRRVAELYFGNPSDGGKSPEVAAAVYSEVGNVQHRRWLEQVDFLIDDVGLDGTYIDQFSLALNPVSAQRYTYDRWDGVTVDIDPKTGLILRKYADLALLGIPAQLDFMRRMRARKAVLVANTHSAARETQSEPVARFSEAGPEAAIAREWPPRLQMAAKAQLSSPVALGYDGGSPNARSYSRSDDPAEINRIARAYLAQGVLYYHFYTVTPADAGYEALNRMFPITPVRIGHGWIEGRERIVTTRSGEYRWPHRARPEVRAFDASGRAIEPRAVLEQEGAAWKVRITLRDWQEMSILEGPGLSKRRDDEF